MLPVRFPTAAPATSRSRWPLPFCTRMKPRHLLALLALACLSSVHADERARDADTLRVMVWNTERGSNPHGPDGRQRLLRWIQDCTRYPKS